MKVVIPKEIDVSEERVAIAPKNVDRFKKLGFEVYVQSGAGEKAGYSDVDYEKAGANIISSADELYSLADIILKVQPLTDSEIPKIKKGALVLSYLYPSKNQELLNKLASAGINAIAMDAIPRISRAQKMDVLSSMANIAGYRAVIEAAHHFWSLFKWSDNSSW